MREAFATRLKELRIDLFGPRGQAKMAKALGVSPTTYNSYEKRCSYPLYPIMARFCLKYNVNPLWLLEGRGNKYTKGKDHIVQVAKTEPICVGKATNIPVLKSVGASDPRDIKEIEPIEHVLVDNHFVTPGMVGLRVHGNSMESGIPDTSIVGVDVRKMGLKDLKTRRIYVLWVRHEGLIIRRLYKDGKDLSFVPDNPAEGNRPYIYTYLKKERRYSEEPIINGRVEWVLNKLNR